ncbi:MAG: hypothetical protein Kow0029_28240 [Candidatus Rifleibacteriota bacterium]
MRPLYPAIFNADEAFSLKWAERNENRAFFYHLLNVCKDFPSLLMGYSADTGIPELAAELGRTLIERGINVFMPSSPTPLASFSQSVGARQMPIGLYLSYDSRNDFYQLSAITNHGGPIDEQDIKESKIEESERNAVLGTTDYDLIYLNSLKGLADQYIEDGIGFKTLCIPFPELEKKMQETPELAIIFKRDEKGPVARITNDGQGLIVTNSDGTQVSTEEMADLIINYLIRERLASGTIIGPIGRTKPINETIEIQEIDGTLFDMNYHAAFADLLVGWWDGGIIAHQGSSCFGDGILTAIYYLEALRTIGK